MTIFAKIATMDLLKNYFPDLTDDQLQKFEALEALYKDWNTKINVVSRKDIDELYLRHVLHSMGIAKVQPFHDGAELLDVGTGGGFPGVPLAILSPNCSFHLVDSINKKLKVIDAVAHALDLTNVRTSHIRAEKVSGSYDFILSRAVTAMPTFVSWVKDKIKKKSNHELKNGILYLKGGNLSEELQNFPKAVEYNLSDYFEEAFFDTKKVVHLPLKFKPKIN